MDFDGTVLNSTIVDDTNPNVTYAGAQWTVHTNVDSIYHLYNATDTFTDVQGATATLKFFGNAIEYWGNQGPYHGPCGITLDGQDVGTVNSHAAADDVPILLYGNDDLTLGDHTMIITVKAAAYPNVCEVDKFVVNITSHNGNTAETTTIYVGPGGTNNGGSTNKSSSFPVAAVAGAVGGVVIVAILLFWWWWVRRGNNAKKTRRDSLSKLKIGPQNVTPLLAGSLSPRDVEKDGGLGLRPAPNHAPSYTSSSPPPSTYTPSSPPASVMHTLSQYQQHPYNNTAAINPNSRPMSTISTTTAGITSSHYTSLPTATTTDGFVVHPQNQQPYQPYQPQLQQQQSSGAIIPVWAIPAPTSPPASSVQPHSAVTSPSQSPTPGSVVLPPLAPVQHQATSSAPSDTHIQYRPEKAIYRGPQAPPEKARYTGPQSQGYASAGSGSGIAGAGSAAAAAPATSTSPVITSPSDVITPDLPPPAYQV